MSKQTLIRLKNVLSKTGLSRSHTYALIGQGRFPKPVKLSEKSVAWVESEIDYWIEQRIAERAEVA